MKSVASEVSACANGLVVVGSKGPGTRVWFRPTGALHLHEFILPFVPPRESPAALLPGGRLLVVGRNGESMIIEGGRSPQPGPVLANVVLEGLSTDLVVFARGPRFFRFVDGAWKDESPAEDKALAKLDVTARIRHTIHAMRGVAAVGDGLAVGADGDCWVVAKAGWKKVPAKTKASLRCAANGWAGGEGVLLERKGKVFKAHKISGDVTSICGWKKGALVVIDGALFDQKGTRLKAPAEMSSIASHGGELFCIARGGLYESSDAREWRRKALPK
jgi:hypothetical protein